MQCKKCLTIGDERSFGMREDLCDNCASEPQAIFSVDREDYSAMLTQSGQVFTLTWNDHLANEWSSDFSTFAEAIEGLARLERNEAVGIPGVPGMSEVHEHDWQLTENGYSRSWSTEIETDPDGKRTIVASWGGSEDFSEGGDGQMFLECLQCGATEDVDPETTEIEYL